MNLRLSAPVILAMLLSPAAAAPPVVANIRASQIAGTKNVEVLYDVSDADGDALTIGMQVSGDAGQTYTIPSTALSGNIGAGVAPGTNRRIVWNAGADWNGQLVTQAKVRVTAADATTPAPPPGMVYIPAGVFQMGDNLDAMADAMPVRNVFISALFMDRFEVTRELWQSVLAWSAGHGYGIVVGQTNSAGHPVWGLDWYQMAKWCNARSEMERLTPCYHTDAAQTLVFRTDSGELTNEMVKWNANGYRLPTEAEWEKASRGGVLGQRYPWGNSIVGSQANYTSSGDAFEGIGAGTTPVGYYDGDQMPTGVDMANGYGLYDMAGNAWEWCWDWYGGSYYSDTTANSDPHGPTSGSRRVLRGGSCNAGNSWCRVASRYFLFPYESSGTLAGFRCVRKAP